MLGNARSALSANSSPRLHCPGSQHLVTAQDRAVHVTRMAPGASEGCASNVQRLPSTSSRASTPFTEKVVLSGFSTPSPGLRGLRGPVIPHSTTLADLSIHVTHGAPGALEKRASSVQRLSTKATLLFTEEVTQEALPTSRATIPGTGRARGAATMLRQSSAVQQPPASSAKWRAASPLQANPPPMSHASHGSIPVTQHDDSEVQHQKAASLQVRSREQAVVPVALPGRTPDVIQSFTADGYPRLRGANVEQQVQILSNGFDRMCKDLEVQKADLRDHTTKITLLREHFDELTRKVDHMFETAVQRMGHAFEEAREGRARSLQSFDAELLKVRDGQQGDSNFAPRPGAATVSTTKATDAVHDGASISSILAAWPRLEAELKEECIERNKRLAELQSQLQQEVAGIRQHMLRQSCELAEQTSKVEIMVDQERIARTRESAEVRAIIESLENKVDSSGLATQDTDDAVRKSRSVRDSEDLPAIHAMVQEVCGNLSRLSVDVVNERRHRHNQLNAMRLRSERLRCKVELLLDEVLPNRIVELHNDEWAAQDEQLDLLGSDVESEIMERVDQRVAALVAAYGRNAAARSETVSQGPQAR